MSDECEHDQGNGEEPAITKRFPVYDDDKPTIDAICSLIRTGLKGMRPKDLRSAAAVLLALERFPSVTPGVNVTLDFLTPSRDGNFAWAGIDINEYEFRLGFGEHFYDPAVGGDTESRTIFEMQAESGWRAGEIEEWFEIAAIISDEGCLSIEDNSDFSAIEWHFEEDDREQ